MKWRVEVVCVDTEGKERRQAILELERQLVAMETLGLNLDESKTLLEGVQKCMANEQVAEDLRQRRRCPDCGECYRVKTGGTTEVKTLFGVVEIANPRWERCACQEHGPKTFRPAAGWLRGRTSPELLYLETKWASILPFAKVAELLCEVLPVDAATNHETIRRHLQATAQKMEQALGEERSSLRPEPAQEGSDWEQPPSDGPITVGIDGGYVRAAHKQGFFEVIAGRSVVAFRRDAEENVPEAKCFGYVQTYDRKPRQRLWEMLKSQGLQDNQQVVFLSDGGEDVRGVQAYLQPGSEHWIDWFHITMRLTVLQQQTKSLRSEVGWDAVADGLSKQLESIKHLLWHGNVCEALERQCALLMRLEFFRGRSAAAERLTAGLSEFDTYIRNNQEFIPNFGERYRQGETISTAFVESTINQVVSRRLVKKQQMQWTPRGAHLLLQTRTKVLNGELEAVFQEWYPQFHAKAA